MSREVGSDDSNYIDIDEEGRLVAVLRGAQTQQTLKKLQDQLQRAAQRLHQSHKKVLILIDARTLSPTDADSGSRRQARLLLEQVPFDKFAVCGKRAIIILAAYLVRLSGKGKRVQFFSNERKAKQWLMKAESYQSHQASISLLAGSVVATIGLLTLIGWQFNIPLLTSWHTELPPMNPVSALALMVVGVGFITYSTQRLRVRLFPWIGLGAILFGIVILLPIRIDTIFFANKIEALGPHADIADSAAMCFIALGVVAMITQYSKMTLRRMVEIAMITVIGTVTLINIFGILYAHDWIYSLGPYFVMPLNLAVAFALITVALVIMLTYNKVSTTRLATISRTSFLILIVLTLTQMATYLSWSQATARNKASAETTFQKDAVTIERNLKDRFTNYTNLLYGYQGLFQASDNVSQGEFETYYRSTGVAKNYPGLETLSFISKVSTKDLPAFTQTMRADTSLHASGNPTFTITQQSPSNDHYILTYVAGSSVEGGSDFGSNAARLETFRQAEMQKRPIASGTVTFAATAASPALQGFFISVPITSKQNPSKVIGFVNAIFSYTKFFNDTFDTSTLRPGLSATIVDKSDGRTLFSANNNNNQKPIFNDDIPIEVANRLWLLTVTDTGSTAISNSTLPRSVLVSGQIFSILLIIIFWLQSRARREALNLADNVTEDLQQERNIAVASDQRNRTIFSSIGDGIFAIDEHRIITLLNPAAARIIGYTDDKAVGQPYPAILRFQHEKTGKISDEFIKKALSGQTISIEDDTVLVRKDGKYIRIATSAAPIRDASDLITGVIVVFRDVTEGYELEKAKSEFVSITSHQLRTPLSAINWYSEMLIKGEAGKLTEDQTAYMNEIFEGSNRMNELVNALLNASRLEIDKLSSQPEPTDLAALIDSLSKELDAAIKGKSLTLRTHVTPIPTVDADPKQLRMIVQNIMSNAVKYTSSKGIIDVTLRPASSEDMLRAGLKKQDQHWLFSVQDTGYGIPKDDQPKIFNKLFRADNARSLNVEGTGLGLYIVKQVVDKMGGHVWFESIESVGTTFYVVAPVKPKRTKNDVYNKTQEE